jgi:uncharacterized membrane protein YGL010W
MVDKDLIEYLKQYREAHRHPGTRLTHMVGIPMIAVSLPLALLNPLMGGGLFVGGWVLQFIGHYVFEHNNPQFFGDPVHLLIGVIWAALEWGELVGLHVAIPA